jgi:hypothetical protein
MKNNLLKLLIALTAAAFSLAGCLYGQCINGPCALEHKRIVESIKPYGAHWAKEGMTRESRRVDSWACGAARTVIGAEHPVFPDDELKAAKLPSDLNDILANSRLTKKWATCMRDKGYVYIDSCDARCLYP